MTKTLVLAAALAFTAFAQAQPVGTATKKELVAKILQAQHGAIEQMARQLVEQPAAQLLQRAGLYIQQRVPADKREAMARDIQADARKYAEETFPVVRDRAVKLGPTTIGAVLEDKLSEDELRQLATMFESTAFQKFHAIGPEMQKSLGEKLIAEVKSDMEARLRALDRTMSKRLGVPIPASGAGTGK